MTFATPSVLRIDPLISFSLDIRATSITFHPSQRNMVLIGFEDGSVRSVHIGDGLEFQVMSVMRSQMSWFESTAIRSVVVNDSNPDLFMICDEVVLSRICE